MIELNREDPLFDAQLPVRMRARSSQGKGKIEFGEEETLRPLNIRILTGSRQTKGSSATLRERLLHVEITDELEPYFLFTLDVGEDDFHELKKDQALLVDFDAFPNKFIELLENCISFEGHNNQSNASSKVPLTLSAEMNQSSSSSSLSIQPKYLARLETKQLMNGGNGWDSALLSMIETNPFKQLTHLSLQFCPGNDSTIKRYLAGRLYQMLTKTNELSDLLAITKKKLEKESIDRAEAVAELSSIHQARATELRELNSKHASELALRREQGSKDREIALSKVEEARSVQQQILENALENLRLRLDKAEKNVSSLTELKYKHEAELKDIISKNEAIEKQHSNCLSELTKLRNESTIMETKNFNFTIEVQKYSLKCAAYEQQIIDKDVLIKQGQELSQQSEISRKHTENELLRYKTAISSLQDKLKSCANEIHKGNDIISKLQNENKILNHSNIMKSNVMRKQEKIIIEEKEKLLLSSQASHVEQLDKERLLEKFTKLKNENNELNNKLLNYSNEIEKKQQMIDWLNKELTKLSSGGGFGNISSSSSIMKNSTTPITNNESSFPQRHASSMMTKENLFQNSEFDESTNFSDHQNSIQHSKHHVDLSGVKSWILPQVSMPQHDGLEDIRPPPSNWQKELEFDRKPIKRVSPPN